MLNYVTFLHLPVLIFFSVMFSSLQYHVVYVVQLIVVAADATAAAMATAAEQVFLWHCLTVLRKNGVVLSTPYMEYDTRSHTHAYPHAHITR